LDLLTRSDLPLELVGRGKVRDIYVVDARGQRLAELIGVHNHAMMQA
jgi:hypothetical protein